MCRPSAVCRLWDVFQDKCHYFLRKPAWEKFKGKQACQSQFLNACLSLGFGVLFLLPCNLSSCWMGGSLARAQLRATSSFLLVMLWIHLLIQDLQTWFLERHPGEFKAAPSCVNRMCHASRFSSLPVPHYRVRFIGDSKESMKTRIDLDFSSAMPLISLGSLGFEAGKLA